MKKFNNINEFIRARLVELRTDNDLKSTELSRLIGREQSYISKVEKGHIQASFELINKCCLVFNIPIADFFSKKYDVSNKINKNHLTKQQLIILNNMKELSEYQNETLVLLSERLKKNK